MNTSYIRQDKFPLLNMNSCGQGIFPDICGEPLFAICDRFGYEYSHSTNTGQIGGGWKLWHTFKHKDRGNKDHCIGFYMGEVTGDTCVSIATARKFYFKSAGELERHLEYKRSQYKLRAERDNWI